MMVREGSITLGLALWGAKMGKVTLVSAKE
jgi:hypothetical protein